MHDIERPDGIGNPEMAWSSDAVAEMLRRLGLPYLAMNPGASYRGLHDSLVNYLGNRDPQMLLCLNEGHAVAIAHGYAKVTGKPMGCILHSNVGLMAGLMQVFNAWCARVPIVLIGAGGPIDADQRRPWVDWIHTAADQGALLRNYTKWDNTPASVPAALEALLRAHQIASTAPMGPVYVCLDAGLQEQRLDDVPALPDVARFGPGEPAAPSQASLERAIELLANAQRPLIFCGRVSREPDDWAQRIELAERIGAKVVTDLRAGAAFPTDHPLHGPSPRPNLPAASQVLFREADVILALDAVDLAGALKLASAGGPCTAKIIHCSVDSYVHNGWSMDHQALPPVDVRILTEPDAAIAALLPRLADRRIDARAKWGGKAATAKSIPAAPRFDAGAVGYDHLTHCLAEARKRHPLTIVRVGLGWASERYHFREPLDFLGWDGGGGLGAGPGMAVGAALALKDSGRIALTLVGDSDFLQGATALWTAAHYRLPALVIVTNNRSNFNDEIHQELVARERDRPVANKWIGMRMEDPALDIVGLARAQGVEAAGPIVRADALPAALDVALEVVAAGRPYLLDVMVEPSGGPLLKRA